MEHLILWLGFIGGWLLFAGPIYQAALELKDEDIEIDRIRQVESSVPKPAKSSVWWWLFPPIKLYQEFRRSSIYRRTAIKALSPADLEAMVSFQSKATGWLFVAVGGFCMACKETFELGQHNYWTDGAIIAIIGLMLLLSLINLIYRLRKAEAIKRAP